MRTYRNTLSIHSTLATLLFLALPAARATERVVAVPAPPPSLAFARYIASLQTPDAFQQPGDTLLTIQASLPDLYKEAAVIAVRRRDEHGVCAYAPVDLAGDGSVLVEVIDRYLELERELEASPERQRVSPANYKFRYEGQVKTGLTPAFVFRVTPKKRGPSSFDGKIWIDQATGAPILYAGEVGGRKINVVRDIRIVNGAAVARLDHVSFSLPQLGRAEVVVTQLPISDALSVPQQPAHKSPLDAARALPQVHFQ